MDKYDKPTWTNYLAETWASYLPPIRPAAEELDIFRNLLITEQKTRTGDMDVLILGSTPELRDLSHSFGVAPTVVDYSETNYLAMGLLRHEPGEEQFVDQNWLSMDLCRRFDVILSEAAFGVVPREALDQLLSRVQSHLKPTGAVFAKTWIRLSDERPDLDDIIQRYRARGSERDFYSALCLPLMLHFYDYQSEKISVRHLSMQVEELFKQGKVLQAEWESIRRHHYENADLELHIPRIDDLLVLLRNYFVVEDIKAAPFDYSGLHPIFVCRAR